MLRLVVVLPLRPLRVGDGFSLARWPLHLTVAPTFVVEVDLDAVVAAVGPVLERASVLTLQVGADEGFGRAQRIPVSLVEPTPELTDLHGRLVQALSGIGAVFDDPDFTGTGYRPHVTVRQGDRVDAGDVLQPTQAIVVDMEPQGDTRLRKVVWARGLTAPQQF